MTLKWHYAERRAYRKKKYSLRQINSSIVPSTVEGGFHLKVAGRGGGGGARRKFSINTLKYIRISFDGRVAQMDSFPLRSQRYQFSNNTCHILS